MSQNSNHQCAYFASPRWYVNVKSHGDDDNNDDACWDNFWLVHQSSLAVLPAETSVANRRNGLRTENFASQYLKYLKWSFTCRKILRHGTSGFTSHPKEGVLRIFIALKNPSPRLGLNSRPLGPAANKLTTTPTRRLLSAHFFPQRVGLWDHLAVSISTYSFCASSHIFMTI
jgi:hypothetical protein